MSTADYRSDSKKELSFKQAKAALLLAHGSNHAQTCLQVGICEKTLSNWKKNPDFRQAVGHAEDEIYGEQLRRLKRIIGKMIDCLERNTQGKVSAYVQVQASSKLLDAAMDVHSIQALEKEISELRADLERGEDP